ncbi:MAG TPA: hypothetical protein VJN64_10735 [Terriglobales bacterium]|nr:hypothetical protein [Terriglobales bacterium]
MRRPVAFHCLGGFVIAQLYQLLRPTVDVDTLVIAPNEEAARLLAKAGKTSELHRKYKVYLDLVTVANVPEDYESRLNAMFAGTYTSRSIHMIWRWQSSDGTASGTEKMYFD